MPETFLGSASVLTDEEREARDKSIDIAVVIAEQSYGALKCGQLSFEKFVRIVTRSAAKADFLSHYREMHVGRWVSKAVELSLPKRGRGNPGAPVWHREMAAAGVAWAKGTGAAVVRETAHADRAKDEEARNRSAYAMAADYLTGVGLPTTPAQVELWYSERKER